jgi:asparagine synthase (glutamine-hydrolysing)
LRQLAYRAIPAPLLDRPKMGFGVPIDRWLRGPLRDWAESLLSREELESCGIFRPEPVEAIWRDHLAGTRSHAPQLWMVLMLQAWWREARPGTPSASRR